jgi:hypothetical protein
MNSTTHDPCLKCTKPTSHKSGHCLECRKPQPKERAPSTRGQWRAEALELHAKGLNPTKIALKLGVVRSSVYTLIKLAKKQADALDS